MEFKDYYRILGVATDADLKTIAADSQNGQRLRIKGKGLRTRTGSGDLYAVLRIEMPASCNACSETEAPWASR